MTQPQSGSAPPLKGPPEATQPPPPAVALRTYRFLRLGVVAVILLLAASVLRESFEASPNCLQGSISAYYYTPVRTVFVGALVVLGFTMIALWGKTPFEDSFFNLAGMLAPVVAFVPTSDTNKCLLVDAAGEQVKTDREKQDILDASHAAIDNNMYVYLLVVGLVLGGLLLIGIVAHTGTQWKSLVEKPYAFWGPWAAAAALWFYGLVRFNQDGRKWLYEDAHFRAAVAMFVLIVAAIISVGIDKYRGKVNLGEDPDRSWAVRYLGLAGVMSAGAAVIYLWPDAWGSKDFFAHQIFWLEAWMIAGVAIFWLLQTRDRWTEGAPRTTAEVARAELVARQAIPEEGGAATGDDA